MLESQLDGLEFLRGTGGEVGDGAVFNFAFQAEGLAEEDTVIGVAVDRGFGAVEIHSEHIYSILVRIVKNYHEYISGYTSRPKHS